MIELRPHQIDAINQVRASLSAGKRPILSAPCGFGKTLVACWILMEAAKRGKRGFFVCDRIKLVSQACTALEQLGADFSVMQGQDYRYNPNSLIQVCSVQTLIRKKNIPDYSIMIIDEAHTVYRALQELMDRRNIGTYYLGLSATPLSKGLGKIFNDLVVPITPRELIKQGYLVPTNYYAGHTIDTSKLKTRALPTGGSDYDPKALAKAVEADTVLEGDVIENIKLHGKGRRGICFSPSIEQSKALCRALNANGITAEHISGYTPEDERIALYEAHKAGDFQLLCNSMILSVGYDDPGVSLLCCMYPTKSKLLFVQRAGRIWRTDGGGKTDSVYLDFSGNLRKHGFPEDIVPVSLDDGEKKFREENQVKKEEKEPKMNTCPQCSTLFTGRRCFGCGYEIPKNESIYHDDQILQKVEKVTMEDKTRFYQELLGYSLDQGYNEGWAAYTYKEKYKVWPRGIDKIPRKPKSDDVLGFIKHKMIRRAHARRNSGQA